MEHSSSREVNNSLARQEITRILWNPKVSKHVHNSQPLVPILSHISSVHESTTCFSKYSLILSPILRLGLASALFPSNFPSKALYEHLFPYSCPKPRPSLFFFLFHHQMVFGDGSRLYISDGRSLHKYGLLEAVARER